MIVDAALIETATRLKRQTTNRDVLALCEAILSAGLVTKAPVQMPDRQIEARGCPECARRRGQKAASQKRRRGKHGQGQG